MALVTDAAELLRRKQRLDQQQEETNHMAGYDAWVVDALELLLRLAFEQKTKR